MRNRPHYIQAATLLAGAVFALSACDSNKRREVSPMVPANPPDSPTSVATDTPVGPTPVSPPGATVSGSLVRVSRDRMCVTLGALEPHETGAHGGRSREQAGV
jgi:hypothetical protein